MSSIICRIATGVHAARKVSMLQALWADADAMHGDAGRFGGLSLHAGVVAQAHERDKPERLCRYITRPAIASMQWSISTRGGVRYELETPWRSGAAHVEFEPIDCNAKPAPPVRPPRATERVATAPSPYRQPARAADATSALPRLDSDSSVREIGSSSDPTNPRAAEWQRCCQALLAARGITAPPAPRRYALAQQ